MLVKVPRNFSKFHHSILNLNIESLANDETGPYRGEAGVIVENWSHASATSTSGAIDHSKASVLVGPPYNLHQNQK